MRQLLKQPLTRDQFSHLRLLHLLVHMRALLHDRLIHLLLEAERLQRPVVLVDFAGDDVSHGLASDLHHVGEEGDDAFFDRQFSRAVLGSRMF